MDCRPPCVDGAPSSSSEDSRETKRSDVVANGVVFFGLPQYFASRRAGANTGEMEMEMEMDRARNAYSIMGLWLNGIRVGHGRKDGLLYLQAASSIGRVKLVSSSNEATRTQIRVCRNGSPRPFPSMKLNETPQRRA